MHSYESNQVFALCFQFKILKKNGGGKKGNKKSSGPDEFYDVILEEFQLRMLAEANGLRQRHGVRPLRLSREVRITFHKVTERWEELDIGKRVGP